MCVMAAAGAVGELLSAASLFAAGNSGARMAASFLATRAANLIEKPEEVRVLTPLDAARKLTRLTTKGLRLVNQRRKR